MELRTGLFFTWTYNHLLRPGMGMILPTLSQTHTPIRRSLNWLDQQIYGWVTHTDVIQSPGQDAKVKWKKLEGNYRKLQS